MGKAGTVYALESSTNGTDWVFYRQGIVESEWFEIIDRDSALTGRQFYRVSTTGAPPAEQPSFSEVRLLPEGAVALVFDAPDGRVMTLQTSTDLVEWFDLKTAKYFAGINEVIDPGAGDYSARFYRVFVP